MLPDVPRLRVQTCAPRTFIEVDRHFSSGRFLYWTRVIFRDRLFATIRAARPVLEVPDVLIVGSEVPNLLEPDAASTLVV
jgi:hypothetical protein